MEWCNQITSIKYLFKFSNKGCDIISVVIVPSDKTTRDEKNNINEIKQYLDCRYIFPSEACWRILSYSIHENKSDVERLFSYIKGENLVYYKDYEKIWNILLRPSVTESMFTIWFEENKNF